MTALPLQQRVLRRVANAPRIRVANAPRLVVVPPPARHPLLLTVASLLVFAAAVFGAVTFNALAADEAVLARQVDGRLGTAESQYSQLLAEVAGLESPARIADSVSGRSSIGSRFCSVESRSRTVTPPSSCSMLS